MWLVENMFTNLNVYTVSIQTTQKHLEAWCYLLYVTVVKNKVTAIIWDSAGIQKPSEYYLDAVTIMPLGPRRVIEDSVHKQDCLEASAEFQLTVSQHWLVFKTIIIWT